MSNGTNRRSIPKTRLQFFLVFFIIFSQLLYNIEIATAQTPTPGPTDPIELTAFFDGAVTTSLKSRHVPGAVVVVVKDGEVFFAKGYGYADLETFSPVDPARTLFRPGSVSKLFTWTAVMQLVEQGSLSLDEDVNSYLDFKIPATFTKPITLRDLMTHTAGFEDLGDGLFKLDANQVSSLEDYVKQNPPARVFPPGEIAAYSNYGTALSGYIVERVSGIPFTEYIQTKILEPLDMKNATFEQPLPSKLSAQMSSAYNYQNGDYIKGSFEFVVGTPAGALSATGMDMANFMIAHLQDGVFNNNRILQEKTAIQMHSPLYLADPRLDGMAYGFFQNMVHDQYVISHGGDTMLFHSNLTLIPEQNLGLFISTNGANGNQMVENLVSAFMDHYFPVDQIALTPTTDFENRAAIYAGEYTMARSNFTAMERILSLLTPVRLTVDQNQLVGVNIGGRTIKYVEVEPGYLVNPENSDDRLVLKENNGQVSIIPAAPFVFLKNSWYGTGTLHILILGGGALIFLVTVIFWGISFLKGLKIKKNKTVLERSARLAGILFGLGFLIFIARLGLIFGTINPAFGVPDVYFGYGPDFDRLFAIPIILLFLGLLMSFFSIFAWIKRYWSIPARIYYNILTMIAIAILWSMIYWNLLL